MTEESETQQRQQHPIVRAYLRGDPPLDLPWKLLGATHPAYRAVRESKSALEGKSSWDKAIALHQQANEKPPEDPDLALLLLCVWSEASFHAGRHEEMGSVLERCGAMIRADTPAGLRALLLIQEGLLASIRGDRASRLRLLREAASLPSRESLHGHRMLGVWGYLLAQLGRLAEFENERRLLETGGDDTDRAEANLLSFVNAVEVVDLPKAAESLAEIEASGIRKFQRRRLEMYREPFRLLSRRWSAPRPAAPTAEDERALPDWALVIDLLHRRRCEEALESARRHEARQPRLGVIGIGYDSFDLLRAELANGNGEAARRILEMRRQVGNVHYLEDFFQARVELLAGRRDAAARLFAAASASCDRYGAAGRLALELRLACEVAPVDLVWLGRESEKIAARSAPALPAAPSATAPQAAAVRGIDRILGPSAAMAAVRERVLRLSALDAPVLITGETGTGKELVARAIHEAGPRAGEPFVAVNCGAISDSLLEAELFGHERGAFTGAERARRGIFEEAGPGTVFLDEVGEVSPRLQVALLRVLETGEIRPLGSAGDREISCRILAATNASLEDLVGEKRFRPDLLYRLRRLELGLPPLRERREDIAPLAEAFLCEGRGDGLRPVLAGELRERLLARDWPGNVRELRNAIERMRLLNSEKLHYGLGEFQAVEPAARAQDGAGSSAAAAAAGTSESEAQTVPARPSPGPAAPDVAAYLQAGRTPLRRLERMRELFREHARLTRAELAGILGTSVFTATRDLKVLIREGLVARREPTPSPRTHYFELAEGSAKAKGRA